MHDNLYRMGLLTGKILSETEMKTNRWDPKVSHIAGMLQTKYAPLLPILRELKVALVSLLVVLRA